ncbi:hypothetical protein [Hoeflea sp.]|uniref:hypothetical protein n=1 Tax=Hoeflea sp. TaxID=1940281 RepID=UPI003B018917
MRERLAVWGRLASLDRGWTTPVAFGVLGLFLSTSSTAFSDMASVVTGAAGGGERWQTYLVDAPAGSIHDAELVFTDPVITGSTRGVSMKTSDGRTIAFRHKNGNTDAGPDEDRVTRDQKRGRVTSTVPVAPPKNFTAGSILERRSMVTTPADLDGLQMAVRHDGAKRRF